MLLGTLIGPPIICALLAMNPIAHPITPLAPVSPILFETNWFHSAANDCGDESKANSDRQQKEETPVEKKDAPQQEGKESDTVQEDTSSHADAAKSGTSAEAKTDHDSLVEKIMRESATMTADILRSFMGKE